MKPVLYVSIAMTLYAFMNVVLEQKLAKYNTSAILVCSYVVMLPLAFARWGQLRLTEGPVAFPTGWLLVMAFGFGALYFAADYLYVASYTAGGSVMAITTVMILLPAFSSLIKFIWIGGGLPNTYQFVGYLLAVAAIYFVAKGSTP